MSCASKAKIAILLANFHGFVPNLRMGIASAGGASEHVVHFACKHHAPMSSMLVLRILHHENIKDLARLVRIYRSNLKSTLCSKLCLIHHQHANIGILGKVFEAT